MGSPVTTVDPLAPVRATLRALAARPGARPLTGLAPDLTVTDTAGWISAAALVSGEVLHSLLAAARQRWNASPQAAAALAWKSYTYWASLPAVLGYAAVRRVPLLRPDSVVLRWSPRPPLVTVGLTSVSVAVLASDPVARAAAAGPAEWNRVTPRPPATDLAATDQLDTAAAVVGRVAANETQLLRELRDSLVDSHLAPIVEQINMRLQLGRRTLWGSLASGVAHAVSRASGIVPGPVAPVAQQVLAALGVEDLVEIEPASDPLAGLAVRRRTCCLAFTLPEPKICTDCCIVPRSASRRRVHPDGPELE